MPPSPTVAHTDAPSSPLHCGNLFGSMSALGHPRPKLSKARVLECPLCPESGRNSRRLLRSALRHLATECTAAKKSQPRNVHSITSSASESRLSEIFSPSALAVLKLITSSNLVG